jgi:tRNA-specific adenosine deaminase 1
MKCLPASKVGQAVGNVIHDWHAEVLAMRAFNHFAIEECRRILHGEDSDLFRRRECEDAVLASASLASASTSTSTSASSWHGQPFGLREEVVLYMYCSEAPCGDASMEIAMAAQNDDTPWHAVLLSPWNRASQAFSSRCRPDPLQGLLRQIGSQTVHLPTL